MGAKVLMWNEKGTYRSERDTSLKEKGTYGNEKGTSGNEKGTYGSERAHIEQKGHILQ